MNRRGVALFLSICVLAVVVRVLGSSAGALSEGRALEAEQSWHRAAIAYGSAIRMYLPGSPFGDRASERLIALADRAEEEGDEAELHFCLEELRSGWLAVRSLTQPGDAWIREAEARLVPILAGDGTAAWPDPALDTAARTDVARAVLAARDDPARRWVVLMGLGYLVWLGGAGLAIWRGIPADDDAPVRWTTVLLYGAISVAGYALWLLSVARA